MPTSANRIAGRVPERQRRASPSSLEGRATVSDDVRPEVCARTCGCCRARSRGGRRASRAGGAPSTSTGAHHTPGSPTGNPPASCVDEVFDRLTLPQRVGQLFSLGLADDRLGPAERDAIRSHHVGSVWFTETTTEGASAVGSVATAVQAMATHAATGGVGVLRGGEPGGRRDPGAAGRRLLHDAERRDSGDARTVGAAGGRNDMGAGAVGGRRQHGLRAGDGCRAAGHRRAEPADRRAAP